MLPCKKGHTPGAAGGRAAASSVPLAETGHLDSPPAAETGHLDPEDSDDLTKDSNSLNERPEFIFGRALVNLTMVVCFALVGGSAV